MKWLKVDSGLVERKPISDMTLGTLTLTVCFLLCEMGTGSPCAMYPTGLNTVRLFPSISDKWVIFWQFTGHHAKLGTPLPGKIIQSRIY